MEIKKTDVQKGPGRLASVDTGRQTEYGQKPEKPAEAKEAKPQAAGLLKKEREFVVPGDKIVDSMEFLPGKNCFRDGNSIYSKKVGIVSAMGRVVSVIALVVPARCVTFPQTFSSAQS